MSFGKSASVTLIEYDKSSTLAVTNGQPAGIVFGAPKGALEIQNITSVDRFVAVYGTPTTVAHFSAVAYLNGGGNLLCRRVTKDALYGGVIAADNSGTSANSGISGQTDPAAYSYNADAITLFATRDPNAESYAMTISYNRTLFGRADGTVNTYTVNVTSGNMQNFIVESGGAVVDPASYNFSGNIISFNTAPTSGNALTFVTDEYYITFYKKIAVGNYERTESPYLVSRIVDRKDDRGRNQYIEEVINNQSIYFRVYDNHLIDESHLPKEQLTPIEFTGGSAGSEVTATEVNLGWDDFANKDTVDVSLLINAGYCAVSDTSTQLKMISVANARKDCFAVLDIPLTDSGDALTPQQQADYCALVLNTPTSYAGIYADWIQINDTWGGKTMWVPPSGYIANRLQAQLQAKTPWIAVAGLETGAVDCIKVKQTYSEADRDTLQISNVNPIRTKPGSGKFLWGEKTLLGGNSALSRVSARLTVTQIEYDIKNYLETQLFKGITTSRLSAIKTTVDKYLAGVLAKEGIYGFLTKCDSSNNTPESIDRNELYCDIALQPVRNAEYIQLTVTVNSLSGGLGA